MKLSDKSATRGAYFSDMKLWLRAMFESHGQVSSNKMILREFSLKMKMSGFKAVARIWGELFRHGGLENLARQQTMSYPLSKEALPRQ